MRFQADEVNLFDTGSDFSFPDTLIRADDDEVTVDALEDGMRWRCRGASVASAVALRSQPSNPRFIETVKGLVVQGFPLILPRLQTREISREMRQWRGRNGGSR